MAQEFKIEIISPNEKIYSGNIEEAILPCFEGQVTILKDHIPFITFLRPGLIDVGKNEKFYVEEGTIEFSNNVLLILSATVQNLKSIKIEQVKTMISETEKKLLTSQLSDKQKYILNHRIDTLKQIN